MYLIDCQVLLFIAVIYSQVSRQCPKGQQQKPIAILPNPKTSTGVLLIDYPQNPIIQSRVFL
jgi:hypothetical protein